MKIVCPHCNFSKEIDASKLPPEVKKATCPKCKEKFDIDPGKLSAPPPPETFEEETISIKERYRPEPDMETEALAASLVESKKESKPSQPPPMPTGSARTRTAPPPPSRDGQNIAWETRAGGFFGDFWATTKHVLFKPGDFFTSMPISGGQKAPLIFGVVWGSFGTILSLFWQAVIMMLGMGAFLSQMGELDPALAGALPMTYMVGGLVAIMVLAPVLTVIGLYIGSAIIHVLLLIVRGGGGGFEATFRVLAYSTSTQICNIVPYLGGFVAGIWALVLMIMGLPKAHNTGVGRVLIAILVIPFVLFIGLTVGMAIVIPLLLGVQ